MAAPNNEYVSKITRPLTERGIVTFFNMFSDCNLTFLDKVDMGANDKYNAFHNIFIECFNFSFPERRSVLRKRDQGLQWFDETLRQMRSRYALICDLYKRNKTAEMESLKRASMKTFLNCREEL